MHKLRNNESYNNFRIETDTAKIIRLKCPSYCQFYMHIISIIVLYVRQADACNTSELVLMKNMQSEDFNVMYYFSTSNLL